MQLISVMYSPGHGSSHIRLYLRHGHVNIRELLIYTTDGWMTLWVVCMCQICLVSVLPILQHLKDLTTIMVRMQCLMFYRRRNCPSFKSKTHYWSKVLVAWCNCNLHSRLVQDLNLKCIHSDAHSFSIHIQVDKPWISKWPWCYGSYCKIQTRLTECMWLVDMPTECMR